VAVRVRFRVRVKGAYVFTSNRQIALTEIDYDVTHLICREPRRSGAELEAEAPASGWGKDRTRLTNNTDPGPDPEALAEGTRGRSLECEAVTIRLILL